MSTFFKKNGCMPHPELSELYKTIDPAPGPE